MAGDQQAPTVADVSTDVDAWVSLHVHHHGDLDALLLEGVRPLLAEFRERELVRDAFFVRYWNGGRHLRLRLRPSRPERAAELCATAEAALQAYLARRPGPVMSAADYERSVAALRLSALLDEPVLPLVPANTVVRALYLFEEGRYGGGAARPAVEAHFCRSSALALKVVARCPPPARLSWVMAAMAIAASCIDRGQGEMAALFRAYFEASWSRSGPGVDHPVRAGYRPYSEQRESVVAALARAAESPAPNGNVEAWCGAWRAHVALTLSRIAESRAGVRGGATVPSVLVSMLHMLNNRLGIALRDEAYVAWLLSEGFSAESIVLGRQIERIEPGSEASGPRG